MPKPKILRRQRAWLASQNQLPLSLPALCTLVYGVLYYHIGMWLVVNFPGFTAPVEYSSGYLSLAILLCFVHGGWLVLLLLNLLAMRTPKGAPLSRHTIGEWCAIVVAATMLVSTLQMIAVAPDLLSQGVFEFQFDPVEGVWTLETGD